MKARTQIPTRTLRWIRRVHIEPDLHYMEVYGRILVPVSHAEKFGVATSTLYRLFDKGLMTRYSANGKPKTTKRKTSVYFDLNELRDVNLEEA